MTFIVFSLVLPVAAKTAKGDKFYAQAKVHEAKQEWDAALDYFRRAVGEDPSELLYQIGWDRARFQASRMHVGRGVEIRAQGRLGDALLEFQKASIIDPGSSIASQEVATTREMILRERRRIEATGQEAPPEIRALTPYEEALRKQNEQLGYLLAVPELKPLDPHPFDLRISGQKARKVFETIAKTAGIDVLWDPEYTEPESPIAIDLQKTTLQDALDYVSVVTRSSWKALSPTAIFIFNDNQNKRRDYDELVSKVIYLRNVAQPADLQEIQNVLRQGCDIQHVSPYATGNALVVRGEVDRVNLCEKLLRDLDKPRSEVMVEILVMEASDSLSKQLTAAVASTGLSAPITFTPRSSIQANGSSASSSSGTSSSSSSSGSTAYVPLSELPHLSSADFTTTLPTALLQAALSDSRTKVLQAPQIRALDNIKSTLTIGDRVPLASGSSTGLTGLVNTQYNYQDIGVNLELTARVVESDEVYMHLKVEISSIDNPNYTVGGVTEPIIGQHKIDQELRVKEGELALIGGITTQQSDLAVTGIPGLMNIPILGKLFSGKSLDHSRDDLMIALIPHIVRRPEYTEENLRSVSAGTQTIKLRYAPLAPVEIPVDGQIPGSVDYAPATPGAPAPTKPD